MKIKAVSELTGLTDRTIRYYIEKELINPFYTENYMGRKNYNFTKKDIKDLNDIAVLRKFDFTLDEIKSVISDSETSKAIISEVKKRTEQTVLDGQSKLSALSQIDTEKSYTVAELAEELSQASLELPKCKEKIQIDVSKIAFSILKTSIIFVIVWLPIILSMLGFISKVNYYRYPVFNPTMIILTLISISPSIAVLILSKTKFKFIRSVLLVFCVLSIPFSFLMSLGTVKKSETTNIKYYRDFDADCVVNRNSHFQELFPMWPHYFENVQLDDGTFTTVYLDAHYYYQYSKTMDYTYDIYAEWPLKEDEYAKEVDRATAVFDNFSEEEVSSEKFVKTKKGDYTCLIWYRGNEPFTETTNYDYLIFAYNDKTNTVRYICCNSLENGADQPYYLQLEW